mmetsp:Transcript_6658/g.14487  ORF Transcript_6658/g.14487 Transcript_6658/m.14487 type:complete len:241 (+) Transcript_6658:116-838(+)
MVQHPLVAALVFFLMSKFVQSEIGQQLVPENMRTWVPLIAAVLVTSLWARVQGGKADEAVNKLVGKPCPDFNFTVNGEKKTLKGLIEEKKKPVLIDMYRNFCPACGPAADEIDRLAGDSKYKGQAEFLLLNLGPEKDVEEFKKKRNLPGNATHGAIEMNKSVASDFGLMYIPHKVLVDKNGTVVNNFSFGKPLEASLDELLANGGVRKIEEKKTDAVKGAEEEKEEEKEEDTKASDKKKD